MIKRYCDHCEDEIVGANRIDGGVFRLQAAIKKKGRTLFNVAVTTTEDSRWDEGDFCKYCVIDAINKADDRPNFEPINHSN